MLKIVVKHLVFAIVVLFSSLSPITMIAQETLSFLDGFKIEIGVGHNQLFWEATEYNGSKRSYNRTAFSIMPNARVSYDYNIFNQIALYSFIGYNESGGHSSRDKNVWFFGPNVMYEDQIKFRNIETGLLGLYSISDFKIGVGGKFNYLTSVQQKYFYKNHPQGLDGWKTDNDDYMFTKWSVNAGIRMEYPIYKSFSIGGEGWFGITDLGKDKFPTTIRENHFRLMIGYQF